MLDGIAVLESSCYIICRSEQAVFGGLGLQSLFTAFAAAGGFGLRQTKLEAISLGTNLIAMIVLYTCCIVFAKGFFAHLIILLYVSPPWPNPLSVSYEGLYCMK